MVQQSRRTAPAARRAGQFPATVPRTRSPAPLRRRTTQWSPLLVTAPMVCPLTYCLMRPRPAAAIGRALPSRRTHTWNGCSWSISRCPTREPVASRTTVPLSEPTRSPRLSLTQGLEPADAAAGSVRTSTSGVRTSSSGMATSMTDSRRRMRTPSLDARTSCCTYCRRRFLGDLTTSRLAFSPRAPLTRGTQSGYRKRGSCSRDSGRMRNVSPDRARGSRRVAASWPCCPSGPSARRTCRRRCG